MSGIIIATLIVGGVGLFVGLFLGVAAIKFKVEVDERETAILEVLPGNNCGGCGYAGCSGLAAAIVKGEAPCGQCPVGGDAVASKISEIMGVEAGSMVKKTAYVACKGTCDVAKSNYEYYGIQDCGMQKFVPAGGPKACSYGCMGGGSCVKACPFDAIHVVNGVAVVDKDACKACGKCVAACPNGLISLIPYDAPYMVGCANKDKGPVVMKACTVGCIGCSLCKKNCPSDAITIDSFNATIDPEKCTGCGTCMEKCPKKIIEKH